MISDLKFNSYHHSIESMPADPASDEEVQE